MAFLEIEQLGMCYGASRVLRNVSFSVDEGELIAILGPSGCGKTTLLNAVSGIAYPSEGKITLSGRDITALPPEKRRFGVVFQGYALFPNLTVEKNVAYGLASWDARKRADRGREMLELVGLADFCGRYPNQLSGGQQQRVALARALAPEPHILLLDEPFSALDYQTRLNVCDDVYNIIRSEQKTAVLVTHDISEAISVADRVLVLSARPARVLASHALEFGSTVPLRRRESPRFSGWFELLWKELNV